MDQQLQKVNEELIILKKIIEILKNILTKAGWVSYFSTTMQSFKTALQSLLDTSNEIIVIDEKLIVLIKEGLEFNETDKKLHLLGLKDETYDFENDILLNFNDYISQKQQMSIVYKNIISRLIYSGIQYTMSTEQQEVYQYLLILFNRWIDIDTLLIISLSV